MKILLITGALGYGGTARALAAYAIILGKKHDVRVWGYDDCEGLENEMLLRDCGFVVYIGRNRLSDALAFDPDIVNLHRPGIFRQRDIDVFKPFHDQGARCIETNVFGRVDKSIANIVDVSIQVSKWDLWQWNKWKSWGYPVRGVYCPNPVDCDAFKKVSDELVQSARTQWGIPVGAKVLGRIGNTNWEALERPLLESLAKFTDLFFLHVDDHVNYMPPSIMRHPRMRRIPRLKGTNELATFYSACDVMASMSLIGESFGYVNAEAMACGTPVIALSTLLHCNAQSEVVSPNEGGYTIAKPEYLPIALERMFEAGTRNQFSVRCREIIEERYSFSACEKILEEIFTETGELGDDIISSVDDQWIAELTKGAMGAYSLKDRIAFKLLYNRYAGMCVRFLKENLKGLFNLLRRFF